MWYSKAQTRLQRHQEVSEAEDPTSVALVQDERVQNDAPADAYDSLSFMRNEYAIKQVFKFSHIPPKKSIFNCT
eukprot:8760314-Karenia_brevis.AAC.1